VITVKPGLSIERDFSTHFNHGAHCEFCRNLNASRIVSQDRFDHNKHSRQGPQRVFRAGSSWRLGGLGHG